MLQDRTIADRHVCWLAQQATEKVIKAALVFSRVEAPRSHDLDALQRLLPGDDWALKTEQLDLAELSAWAVDARYPGPWPEATTEDATATLAISENIVASIDRDLRRKGFAR